MRAVGFWGSVGTLAFAYAGYPALTLLRARLNPAPYRTEPVTPPISIVIAAHNEGAVIARKIASLLAADYPPQALQVIVASDGSEDDTVAAARAAGGTGLTVLELPRVGKAQALNAAIEIASGEILVFTDANSLLAPDALRRLVGPFADPSIGGVAGNQVYRAGAGSAGGELAYWSLDRRLKAAETLAGNAVSATGALYAIRRHLCQPVPEGVTDDFVTSVRVIAQGYRLVFVEDAIAYEEPATSSGAEFGRKVRVMTRGLRGVILMRELLNPRRHGFYSLQLFTQKVLKRLVVIPHVLILATAPLSWKHGRTYRVVALGEVGVGLAALIGLTFPESRIGRSPLFSLPAYFCMANAASAVAVKNVLSRRRLVKWDTPRAGAPELASDSSRDAHSR